MKLKLYNKWNMSKEDTWLCSNLCMIDNRSSFVQSEIEEQYTRVGGVLVKLCVHIKRTDILFDEIFSKFVAVQYRYNHTYIKRTVIFAAFVG